MSAGWTTLHNQNNNFNIAPDGRRPGRPSPRDYCTDTIMRLEYVIYWPDCVTRRRIINALLLY